MTNISNRALLNALYALYGDIATNEKLLSEGNLSEDEFDGVAEYVLELKAALGEFSVLYKERQTEDNDLPSFESIE